MHGNRLPVQVIEVLDGWSGISGYINPQYPDIEGLTTVISNELVIIYNPDGTYWPSIPINTLGDWNSHSGYVINVTADCSMELKGYEESDKDVDLPEGWTMIPVLSKDPVLVTDIFAGLTDLEIVKGIGQNNVCYWPEFGINQLINLLPGVSYYVRMNANGNIDFDGADNYSPDNEFALKYPESSPWNEVKSSPLSHVIAFVGRAAGYFETGDLIGLFNRSGTCTGLIEVACNNVPLAVHCFGDDPLSDYKDGLAPDEMITYQLYRPSDDMHFNFTPEYDGSYNSGNFEENGLSVIVDLEIDAQGIFDVEPGKIRIFPNPSTGIFNIEGITGDATITVFNAFGVEVFTMDASTNTQLDLSSRSKGIYLVRVAVADGVNFEKVVVD